MWARLTTLGQHFSVHTHTLMQPYMISEKHFDYMAHTNDKSDPVSWYFVLVKVLDSV